MCNQKSFDQEIYEKDFTWDDAHLVEASAGTGKTYNIQNIYARLIMEKGLRVSEILVMTFTEAATKELHDRLHVVLKDIQCRLQDQDCPGKDEKDTQARNERAKKLIECAPDKKSARINIELALLEFDKCAISTIHGFCERVLSRYAFETGINLTPDIEDNKSADLRALAEDWWRKNSVNVRPGVTKDSLVGYVRRLSQKTNYAIKPSSPDSKEGYVLKVAQEIIERYEAMRDQRKALNFDDLLRALRDALKENQPRSKGLIESLRREFKAALIDEFQDTDPVQYEIFQRIFRNGNPNPLFFVGDPKQAIYAFRGADIYTYLMAKEKIASGRRYSLGVNYRSTSRMIHAVNSMFKSADGNTFGQETIPYEEVHVEKEPDTKGGVLEKPLQIVRLSEASITGGMSQAIGFTVKKIAELLKETKLRDGKEEPAFSPGDIAILTNLNERNLEIQRSLQEAGIPSVVRHSGNVFASPVARELWLFLQGVSNPSDKEKVRCAAVTVFGGSSAFEIPDFDAQPDMLAHYLGRFREWNGKYQKRGLSALVAELEGATDHNYRLRLANRKDGERLLADMNQIWELCFAAVKQREFSLDELTAWLDKRIIAAGKNGVEEKSEEYAREMESDSDAVKIMTVHGSKGLQFPVVFLPDCWSLFKEPKPLYEFHDPHSGNQLTFSVDDEDGQFVKEEEFNEKTRLLYVGLTRAIERMVVFSPEDEEMQSEPMGRLLLNLRLNCEKDQQFSYETVSVADCGGYTPPAPPSMTRGALESPEFDIRPTKGSFSSLFHGKNGGNDDFEDRDVDAEEGGLLANTLENEEGGHAIFGIRGGADIGSCWHGILEKIPFDADEKTIRRFSQKELRCCGFPDEILEPTVEMVAKTLKYPMTSPDGVPFTLREIPWEQRFSEQGFDFASASAKVTTGELKTVLEKYWGTDASKADFLRAFTEEQFREIPKGFLTGFMDLIFRHGEFFYVIDWKSNSIGGRAENFNEGGVRHEMAKHLYFFQYLLYAVVLHNYLKQTMGEQYSWEKNFGGIRYFFLRGIAADGAAPVFVDRPSEAMLDELGEVFGLSRKGGK